jgi:transposase
LARARLRAKLSLLAEAFTGFFTDQHAFLLGKMLARVDAVDGDLAELDARLEELIARFVAAVDRLDEIPGVGQLAAQLLIAEIGADTGPVPNRRAPGVVGQVRPGRQGVRRQAQGPRLDRARQPYPARVLGEVAVAASKTDPFLGERYRRIARRRGKRRAIVAVGRSILVLAWHLLSDPEAHFHDLGASFYDTGIGPERAKRNHVRQLEALGDKGTLPTRRLTGRHRATGATLIGSGQGPDTAACLLTVDFRIRKRPLVQVQPGPPHRD